MERQRFFLLILSFLTISAFADPPTTPPSQAPAGTPSAECPTAAAIVGGGEPARRIRAPKPFEDEIGIMTVVFGKGLGLPFVAPGGVHVDVQEGPNVWNAKKGWKIYGAYGPRERMGRAPFRPVNWMNPREALKNIYINAHLKPYVRYVLKLTSAQKEAMRNYLRDRENKPKGMMHTCVNATSEMLKEVLGVEVPFPANISPARFAGWMKKQIEAKVPWLDRAEGIGEIRPIHYHMSGIRSMTVLGAIASALGGGGYALHRWMGSGDDKKKKTEEINGEGKDEVELWVQEGEAK